MQWFTVICIMIGLFLGFITTYLFLPAPQVIIKYPNNKNIQNTTYIDENGVCYKYRSNEFKCIV